MFRSRHMVCALLAITLVGPAAFGQGMGGMAAPAARDGILDAIPGDAWGAVIVRNLKGLNGKVVGIGQELGLPIGPGTMVGDPLMMLKGFLGIAEGLDDKGSVALVLLKMEELSADSLSRSMVLLVPCEDPKVFLDQFAAGGEEPADAPEGAEEKKEESKPDDEQPAAAPATAKAGHGTALPKGIVKISLMGKPSFAAVKGKYAVLAPELDALRALKTAKGAMRSALTPERLVLVESKFDLTLWLNMAEVGPAIRDTVKGTLMGLMMMGAMADPSLANQAQPAIENIEKFLDQSASFQMGLAASKTGFALDFYVDAKPGTEMAQRFAESKGSDKSLLVGLPAEKYVLAFAATSSARPEDVKQASATVTGLLDRPEVKSACDPEKLEGFKKTLGEMIELAANGEWMGLSVSRLPEGSDGMIGVTAVGAFPHAGKKVVTLAGKMIESGLGLVTSEDARKVLDAIEYKADAEKVGEMPVSQLRVDLSKIPDAGEEDIAKFKKVVGKDGAMVRIATIGEDHAGMFFGGGPKRIEQVAALVKKGEAPLADDDGFKAIAPNLPKGKRFFEMYCAVDTLLHMVNDVAAAVGEAERPIAGEIPEMKAPVAVVGTVGKTWGRVSVYVPMKVVKGIKEVAMSTAAEKIRVPMEPAEEPAEPGDEQPAPPPDSGVK